MKNIFLFFSCMLIIFAAKAQVPILKKVNIEFERKVNQWASLSGSFAEEMKKNIPQYASTFYQFESDGTKSLYQPIASKNEKSSRNFFNSAAPGNIVYTNFEQQQQISLKSVFEKSFLITDSLRNAEWKITNDFREIAGFNCRRATTIIMDSVFVVAFYTDEIMVSGGPESFSGLPGMIMGLVINRVHASWYATKVSVVDVDPARIVPPAAAKAEKADKEKLIGIINNLFSGNAGRRMDSLIWWLMI